MTSTKGLKRIFSTPKMPPPPPKLGPRQVAPPVDRLGLPLVCQACQKPTGGVLVKVREGVYRHKTCRLWEREVCWKLSYPNPQRAYRFAADYRRSHRGNKVMQRAYHCNACHQWHLTTAHPARRASSPTTDWED